MTPMALTVFMAIAGSASADWADFLGSSSQVARNASGTRSDASFPAAGSVAPALSWDQWIGNDHSSPAVANGKVYIGVGMGGLVRLDLASGNVDWTAAVG